MERRAERGHPRALDERAPGSNALDHLHTNAARRDPGDGLDTTEPMPPIEAGDATPLPPPGGGLDLLA